MAWPGIFFNPYNRPYLFVILCRLAPRNTCVKRVFRSTSEFRAVRTELDIIVNSSFSNLCTFALGLALHVFATQC